MRKTNISLLGLLAIVACAAIAVSHAITSFRLSRANTELATLRQRLELIPVDSPGVVAVRQLPSTDERTRRWAVRIPDATNKVLCVNWGSSSLVETQNVNSASTRTFEISPDPTTRESAIQFTVQRNPNDPNWGSITIDTGNISMISVTPEITSLLLGETPSRSEAIGDTAVTRSARSPVTVFAIESNSKTESFSLWLDDPPPANGR